MWPPESPSDDPRAAARNAPAARSGRSVIEPGASTNGHAAEGYFGAHSVIRKVNRERVLALVGPRALLMQAAHPLAVSGLLAHTGSLDDPYVRLARTAEVMSTITFGSRADADQMTRIVRAMHRRVSGRLTEGVGPYPAGTPYRADDPELLMWILYTLVDSSLVVFRMYVGSLSREEEIAYWEDYKVVGTLFGLRREEMPETIDGLRAYGREMLAGDRLYVSPWARTQARKIVLDPPVPLAARPLVEAVNFITIALLPDPIRRRYGFAPLPTPLRRGVVKLGSEYAKRLALPFMPEAVRLVPAARKAS